MSMTPINSTTVLCWPKKVLSADDLRRHLTSQRELLLLPRTIITPLAVDELKAKGIRIQWQASPEVSAGNPRDQPNTWVYAQEKPDATIATVIQSLERDGTKLASFASGLSGVSAMAAFAELLVKNQVGGIAIVGEPATICCLANKMAGIRAAAVANAMQISLVKKSLAANLYAMNAGGKTFFELRQMWRLITSDGPKCDDAIATLLSELESHAHR